MVNWYILVDATHQKCILPVLDIGKILNVYNFAHLGE